MRRYETDDSDLAPDTVREYRHAVERKVGLTGRKGFREFVIPTEEGSTDGPQVIRVSSTRRGRDLPPSVNTIVWSREPTNIDEQSGTEQFMATRIGWGTSTQSFIKKLISLPEP